MRSSRNSILFISLIFLAGIYGGYPDKITSVTEQDIAATVYDTAAFPGNYTTFSVIDTVMHMTEDGEDDKNLSRKHDTNKIDIEQRQLSVVWGGLVQGILVNNPDLTRERIEKQI